MIVTVGEWSSRVCAVVGRCWMTIKRRLDGVRERVLCGELALNKAGKLEIIELEMSWALSPTRVRRRRE